MANYWTGGRGGGEKNFEHKGGRDWLLLDSLLTLFVCFLPGLALTGQHVDFFSRRRVKLIVWREVVFEENLLVKMNLGDRKWTQGCPGHL